MQGKKKIYRKLAVSNLKSNVKLYLPFILLTIVSVMMYYNVLSLSNNKSLSETYGGVTILLILKLTSYAVVFLGMIFIMYANSFVISRRQKEFGLYTVLGMEKRHICKLLFIENFILMLITIASGLLIGVASNKVLFLLLVKAMKAENIVKWEFSTKEIIYTIVIFVVIFLVLLVKNMISIGKVNIVELFSSNSSGDREPKSNLILAVLGAVLIAIAYYLFLTTKTIKIGNYTVALILIIIGTRFLFTASIIVVLKKLKKNPKFYYKTNNFVSISNLIHRIKRNAAGLSNICILSTMVVVVMSAVVSLYIGGEDNLKKRFPCDINIFLLSNGEGEEKIEECNKELGVEPSVKKYEYCSVGVNYKNGDIVAASTTMMPEYQIYILTEEEYNKTTDEKVLLNENECLLYKDTAFSKNIKFKEINLTCVKKFENELRNYIEDSSLAKQEFIIVKNEDMVKNIVSQVAPEEEWSGMTIYNGLNFDDDVNVKEYAKLLEKKFIEKFGKEEIGEQSFFILDCVTARETYFQLYAGAFFIGIFLAILFMSITTLLIYYKQISEGYDDRDKYVIMQKVGMDKKEVRKTIMSQVRKVFFIPIVMMTAHVFVGMKMIFKFLRMIGLTNQNLYLKCSAGTIVVFFIIYFIIYRLTEREYFKIVNFKN